MCSCIRRCQLFFSFLLRKSLAVVFPARNTREREGRGGEKEMERRFFATFGRSRDNCLMGAIDKVRVAVGCFGIKLLKHFCTRSE